LKAGIKLAGRNNNLRYANDTILMAESEEPLDKESDKYTIPPVVLLPQF